MTEPASEETIWVDITSLIDKRGGQSRFVKTLHADGQGMGVYVKIEVFAPPGAGRPPEDCWTEAFRQWLGAK